MSSHYDRIYNVVRQIPFGQVATYGQIATLAGLPRRARFVGYALYRVDLQTSDVPWHRVINAKGEVSHSPVRNGTDYWQRSLLEAEGLEFNAKGQINLRRSQWQPDRAQQLALLQADRDQEQVWENPEKLGTKADFQVGSKEV